MKSTLFTTVSFFAFIAIQSCQQLKRHSSNETDSTNITTTTRSKSNSVEEYRPKSELTLLDKAKAQYEDYSSTAAQKDMTVTAFNKYALDSLKKVNDWELIVTDVDDYKAGASSFAKAFFDLDNNDIYNVELLAPIHFDKSVDTVAIDNQVDFIYTIPKNPKGDTLKNQLKVIQNLKKGDTVIVSGSVTYFDNNLKVNFADVFDKGTPWTVDFLITSIRKK